MSATHMYAKLLPTRCPPQAYREVLTSAVHVRMTAQKSVIWSRLRTSCHLPKLEAYIFCCMQHLEHQYRVRTKQAPRLQVTPA